MSTNRFVRALALAAVLVAGALSSSPALAQTVANWQWSSVVVQAGAWQGAFADAAAACTAGTDADLSARNQLDAGLTPPSTATSTAVNRVFTPPQSCVYTQRRTVCNSTSGSCNAPQDFSRSILLRVRNCPAGQVPTGPDGTCAPPPNQCAAGAGVVRSVNVTVGWTRTSSPGDYGFVGGRTIPTSACHQGCRHAILGNDADRMWVSPTPGPNGLYRNSADMPAIQSDQQCAAAENPASDPMNPNRPCDGAVGYINGKRACVKQSPGPDPREPAISDNERYGNPTAGTEANDDEDPFPPDDPTGREPTGGNGGNDGGPPSGDAAGDPRGDGTGPTPDDTGGNGDGTVTVEFPPFPEFPEIPDPCGLPGTPPCKIDESGTPDGSGTFDTPAAARDAAFDELVAVIGDAASPVDKDTSWGFAFSLPTGCAPIPIDGFGTFIESIDICPWQGMIHDILSVVWIGATIWCCIGMVGRAAGGA